MKNKKILGGLVAIVIIAVVAFVAVFNNNNKSSLSSGGDGAAVRIGSKDFTENLIIAEIYSLALEDNGYKVERKFNIASSVVHTSLVNDEIDLYPEYTGTGLLSVLGMDLITDPEKVYQTVKEEYAEQFNLTWLDYAAATDSQGLVIRTDLSKKLGITTISQLQEQASQLRFASQGEFDEREDGLAGLKNVYGDFNWKSSKVYDNSLKYSVLENDEADVTPAYTTEGQLVNTDKFTLLEDDKQFWPPYNIAPVVSSDFLKEHSDLEDILNKVSAKLTTENVTEMNAKVDVDGQDYEAVAAEFYATIK